MRITIRDQDAFEWSMDDQIEAFRQQRGDNATRALNLERQSVTIDELHRGYIAGDGETDIVMVLTDWIPEAVERGRLLPLNLSIPDWPDGWHSAMRSLVHYGGNWVALPYHDGPQVFHYRRDLFEGDNLTPPDTWDEFLRVARHFTRDGLWGCCLGAFPDGHNNVYDFLIHLWSRGGEFLDDEGQPRFHEEPGVEALTFMVDLIHTHKVADPKCLELNSVQSGDYYASGQAAMMWNWSGFAATAESPNSKIRGLNALAEIPAGTQRASLNVFWALGIGSNSKDPEEAARFLEFLATDESDRITATHGATGVRLDTWRNPELQDAYPHYRVMEKVHESTRTLPARPDYPAINAILSDAIADAMFLRIEPADALAAAAKRMPRSSL